MADTIRTQAELLAIFADGQNAGAITEQDMRDLIISIPAIQGHHWEFNLDGQYTSIAKKAILAGIRTPITIDAALEAQQSPVGHPLVWNSTTNKIEPDALNDFYNIRLAITGHSDVGTTNSFLVEVDVGGTAGVIFKETKRFLYGVGIEQSFNIVMPLFAGADFLANGGTIYITPVTNASFWEHAITVDHAYKVPV